MGLFKQMKDPRRGIGVIVAALAGTLAWSTTAVNPAAASQAAPALSAAGHYQFHDSFGDNEQLTLNSNNTALFASGCSGIWVTSGSTIAVDINAGCAGGAWIFSGTVSASGLSSKFKPGHLIDHTSVSTPGTWYALKI